MEAHAHYQESGLQFLARMVLNTRESHQITRADAQRLGDLAQFGSHGTYTTMPEERRDASKLPHEYVTARARENLA